MAQDDLKKISFLQGIGDAAWTKALEQLAARRLPAKSLIFEQGQRSSALFALLAGEVEIVLLASEGKGESLGILQAGDVFGEFSYLTGLPRSATAQARTEVTLLELPSDWLGRQEAQYPVLRQRLLQLYRTRVLTNVLHANRVFSVLPRADLVKVVRKLRFKKFEAGAILTKEGSTDTDLFVIKKGSVQIVKQQGKQSVVLGQLTAGEVVGEMALITGEARSASVQAQGIVEAMQLQGDDYKKLLNSYPLLVQNIEEIVQFRAAQTRRALEQVIEEVVDARQPEAIQTATLQVKDLGVQLHLTVSGKLETVTLTHVALDELRAEWKGTTPFAAGTSVVCDFGAPRTKGLELLATVKELPASVMSCEKGQLHLQLTADAAPILTPLITAMARAKVRLFIYPEYDVTALALQADLARGEQRLKGIVVQKISQTFMAVPKIAEWRAGEMLHVTLKKADKTILQMSALMLDSPSATQELQFEYETADERQALETTLRQIAHELGYGKAAALSDAAPPPQEAAAAVVTHHFKSKEDFINTYLNSMEAGILKVAMPGGIQPGAFIKIRLVIDGAQHLRLGTAGRVQGHKNGIAVVELEAASAALRTKIEELCRELVERKSEETLKERRRNLARQGVRIPISFDRMVRHPAVIATFVLMLGLFAWAYYFGIEHDPFNDAPTKGLQLSTKDSEVKMLVKDVQALRHQPGSSEFQIVSPTGTVNLPLDRKIRLSEFQRQQLEALLGYQSRK